jgi:hypothetical protein
MKVRNGLFCLLFGMVFLIATSAYAAIADFEDVNMSVPPAQNYTGPGGGQYYNGSDSAGGFTSDGAYFLNTFTDWGTFTSWDGWAYSNTTDTTTAGFTNQYSSYTGGAFSGTNYGVFYQPFVSGPTVSFTSVDPVIVEGAYFTNTTYAALSMLSGDSFAKRFGYGRIDPVTGEWENPDGTDPDWFKLTIRGIDSNAEYTDPVDFYLADYRFDENVDDYIIDEWTWLDLTGLGGVYGLEFEMSSSDTGEFGMNTPAYFAMDDLETNPVPIPGAVLLLGSGLLALIGIRRRAH